MSVTQTELAKQLGISQRSVSVAFGGAGRISERTRQSVLRAAEEMGYRPNRLASSLRKGQTGSVGVVWGFVNPWTGDSEIGMGVLQRLQGHGLVTYQVQHSDNRAVNVLCERLDELVSRRPEAIVIEGTPGELMHAGVLERIRGIPTVAICRQDLPDFPGDLVIHNRTRAIHEVVDHLVATDRRCLGMALSVEQESNPSKYEAFAARCRDHGLASHPNQLIRLDYPDSPHSHGERHGSGLRRQFPDKIDLDAIFAFNDVGAMYIIQDLKRRGLRVPEDIAVVGFNNTEPGLVWEPPLATGDRAYAEAADQLDRLLTQRLEQPDLPPQRQTVHMRFVWRESAGGHAPIRANTASEGISHA